MLFKFHLLLVFVIVTGLPFSRDFSFRENHPSPKKILGWAVQKTSAIRLNGATNINNFGCDITNYTQPDTIFTGENTNSRLVTLTGDLQIGISKFDCHNKMMTRDLRKILQVDQHPVLVIRFLSLERIPEIKNIKDCLKGWVEIELAGCTKRFEIDYSFETTGTSLIQLNGNRSFSFSDFNLRAPVKFAGLVKVKDKLVVDFTLLLDPIR